MMKAHYSLVIIGAGPAGLSAATTAAEQGLDVAVLDEQSAPGGQIYRAIESIRPSRLSKLGGEYLRGHKLVQAFRASSADYFPKSSVWSLNSQAEVGLLQDQSARFILADRILIANGAMERPMPFPGWTLPGIMYAGAGQILFKEAGLVPEDGVVIAGSGPLLLLLAWQYLQAGVKIRAILDTSPLTNLLRALPHLPRALMAHHYITKGLEYQNAIKRAGVPIIKGVTDLSAEGKPNLQRINYRAGGRRHHINTDLLLTHFGIIPNTHLSRAAGIELRWDKDQQCLRPVVDDWGGSSNERILLAGDGAGIGGARTAEHAGRLAAFQILYKQGLINKKQRKQWAKDDRQWMRDDLHIRPFLQKLFRQPKVLLSGYGEDTIICRCEEIRAGDIRREVTQGHDHGNQVKFISRCGMGPCQGRQCASSVANIITNETGHTISADSFYNVRPPVTPLSLGQLASLYPEETE